MSEKSKIRIARLDTAGGVKTEMCRVYRQMRRRELDTMEGGRLMTALTQILSAGTVDDFEARLAAVEQKR